MIAQLVICLFVCGFVSFTNVEAGCSISLNSDLSDPQPLYLKPDNTLTGNDAFIEPIDDVGTVNFKANEKLTISCPGGKIKLLGVATTKTLSTASCAQGTNFKIEGKTVPLVNITCSKQAEQILRYTGNSCGNADYFKEIEMGFNLDDTRFYTQINVCFDDELQDSPYAVFDMTPSIGGYQANYPRPNFKEAGFYNLGKTKLDDLYQRAKQRTTINKQLGLADTDNKYIHATNDYYLARGHLAAKTDFLYGSQQRLTFNFVNAAPQWQTLNAGNWLRLEDSVRNFASKNALDLLVYTGTDGTLTLPHAETGEETAVYLYSEDFQAIPVPELFWKVVYHPASKSGVAFIAVNNPYADNYEPICTDICDQVTWPTWDPSNQKSGFGYCCDVNEFRTLVQTLPDFEVKSVLNG
ncbi:uncharacterized protein [Atheta coriaria]|uniref:uncharacterized protein isoform X2 n=1 Tax=Dalotia coriaria TaxID=877792 RepID=UPI0031F3DEAB